MHSLSVLVISFTVTRLLGFNMLNYFVYQLNSNWFPPSEASLKRALIQRLIFDLLDKRSGEVSLSPSSDEDELPEINEKDVGVEFVSARCNPILSCQENLASSRAEQGIEMTLLSASSIGDSHCVNDSGLVLKDLFDPGASDGSLIGQCQSFDQKSSYYRLNGAISLMEVLIFLCCSPMIVIYF